MKPSARWALVPALGLSLFLSAHGEVPTARGATAQQEPRAASPPAAKPPPLEERIGKLTVVRLDEVIGMDVRNPAGEDLGTIHDVIIDANDERVRHAVIGFGGFMGLGRDWFAYPLELLELTASCDAVILRVSRE
jgi:hypothetical protein